MAKPKKKPAGKKKSSQAIAESVDADTEASSSSDLNEPVETTEPLKPVIRRPLLFKISFVAFVGWLIYLAYIAYVVLD